MSAIVGPVLKREGGYAFDVWTPERGLKASFRYSRVEDAYYARRFEIRHFDRADRGGPVNCDTVDEFDAVLARRQGPPEHVGATL